MATPRKSSRREFLKGRSTLDALESLTDRIAGEAPSQDKTSPTTANDAEPLLLAPRQNAPTYLVEFTRRAMACDFQISLNAGQHRRGPDAAVEALNLIDQLEDQLTVYREHSEVSKLNRRARHEATPVEWRLYHLLREAVAISSATDGAFDITAGPLFKLWGFFRKQGRLPDPTDIERVREQIGWRHLDFDDANTSLRFRRAGVEINLGAIGKGYALDRAAAVLRDTGVDDFLFHGGRSSLIAFGSRLGVGEGGGWRVAIRHPLRPDRPVGEVRLIDRGMGTSGSGTQFFTHRGRRYGHILDPRTGWPVEGMLSTTVLAPTAAAADALSTAFYVMGVEAALAYCRDHLDVSAVLIAAGERPGTIELLTANLDEFQWKTA